MIIVIIIIIIVFIVFCRKDKTSNVTRVRYAIPVEIVVRTVIATRIIISNGLTRADRVDSILNYYTQ